MPCPSCGGTVREQIAPGYWRCLTQQVTRYPGPGVPGHPEMGPEHLHHVSVCGRTYQEGAPAAGAAQCFCGTFAIGTCAECQADVCGDHSALVGDRRLCHACATQLRKDEATKSAETQEEVLASRRTREIASLRAIADPAERLVATVVWCESPTSGASLWPANAALERAQPWGLADKRKEYAAATRDIVRDVLDETGLLVDELVLDGEDGVPRLRVRPEEPDASGRHGSGWPWDSAAIGKWFARAADWSTTTIKADPGRKRLLPPFRLELRERTGMVKRSRVAATVAAWQIRNVVHHSGQDYSSRVTTAHVYVLRDGRVIRHGPGSEKYPGRSADWDKTELSGTDLRTMAEVLGLDVPAGIPAP